MNCEEISFTNQGTKTLNEHCMKAKREELNLYQPFYVDIKIWKTQRKILKIVSVLAVLGRQYASAKNQFLAGTERPNLNATFCCF